jgi:hypothetical protein
MVKILLIVIMAVSLAACSGSAFDRDVTRGAFIGGTAGAVVGGVARNSVGGVLAGGLIGAVAGGAIAAAVSPNKRCYVRVAPGRWRRARCY